MRLYLFFCTLLAFLCTVSTTVSAQSQIQADCPEPKVEAEVVHTAENGDKGEIILKFQDGDQASNYYIFLKCKECPSKNTATDPSELKNLRKGYYDIYVIAKNGCAKQFNLEVR